MKPLDPQLLRYAGTTRYFLVGCVVAGLVTAGLVVAQAFLLARALADLTLAPLLPLVLVILGRAGLVWLQEVLAHRASARVKSTLRRQVLQRAIELRGAGRLPRPNAALTTLLGSGLDALDGYFARYLPQLVLAAVVPACLVAVLLTNDLLSAVTVALTLPLIPLFMVLVGLATNAWARRRQRSLEVLAHHFTDVIAGLPTLKIFGRAKAQATAVRQVSEAHRRESLGALRLAFLSSLVLELLATLSVALVAVGVGVRLVEGELGLETALIALILAPEAYLPLRLVGQHFHASADGVAAAEEAFRVLAEPAPPAGGAVPTGEIALSIRDLEVTYDGRPGAGPSRLDFDVRPGELVALAGPSGGGKSTVLSVLLRLTEPDRGTVRVDGVDLSELDAVRWRERVGWLPQRPYLFAGTIADNVRLGLPTASDAAVRQALRTAGASDMAPDRPVGERGAGLSAGQVRRVALARALVRQPRLLLLDEPAAGLDPGRAQMLGDMLCGLRSAGRTLLIVSHRPALLAHADRIVTVGPSPTEALTVGPSPTEALT